MLKNLLLRLASVAGLFAVSRLLTRRQLRILCYHGVWIGPQPHYGDCLFMSAERFRRRMAMLERKGYRVVTLDQACRNLREGGVDARDVVITIDDAWAGTGVHMLPVLKAHRYPATLYVTTESVVSQLPVQHVLIAYLLERATRRVDASSLLGEPGLGALPQGQLVARLDRRISALPTPAARDAELERIAQLLGVELGELTSSRAFMLMTPGEIRQARLDGIDVQLHTHTHRMPDFDLDRMRGELAQNRDVLAGILGSTRPLAHFCYPGGAYHPSLFALLRDIGVESATTTEFGLNPPGTNVYALNRILDCESLTEIELEARLSGFWTLVTAARSSIQRALRATRRGAVTSAG